MRGKAIIWFLLLCGGVLTSHAQEVMLSGTVKDSESREPLAYASLLILPASKGTTTDEHGNFTLPLSGVEFSRARLVVSFIGYQPDTIYLGPRQTR